MPTLDNLAARFAQCVSLFRDPSAKTEQKKEFRALLGLLQDAAVTLRLAPGASGIELNGVPCEPAAPATPVERLDLHVIGLTAPPPKPSDALPGVVDRPPPRKESGEELLSLSSERHRAPESPPAAPDPPPAAPDPPAAAKPEAARASAPRATTAATVPLPPGAADVLAELERNSTATNVGDLLAALIDNAAAAAKLGRFEQVLGVIV